MAINKKLFITSGSQCTTETCNYPTTAEALYQFNGNANDTCGNYSITTESNVSYNTSVKKYGSSSAEFNGSSSRITTNYNPNDTAAFSWSCWLNVSAYATTTNDNILGTMESSGPFNGVAIFLDVNDIALTTGGSNRGNIITDVSTNTWHHVAITYNGSGTFTTYAAGSYVSTISQTPVDGGVFWFGQGGPTSWNCFDGLIDQVRIYETELTSGQVGNLFNEIAC